MVDSRYRRVYTIREGESRAGGGLRSNAVHSSEQRRGITESIRQRYIVSICFERVNNTECRGFINEILVENEQLWSE